MSETPDSTRQILKSTSIVGGSQIISIFFGILKTKVLAILLGTSGVGVIGAFQGIIDLLRNITGLGISFSCVREIAATPSEEPLRVAKVVTVMRRWVWGTGLLGMLTGILLSPILAKYSFADSKYTFSVAIISVILLIQSLQEGQLGLLQGLREINKMATARILGAACGLLVTLPIYLFWGMKGIVPAFIINALIMLAISHFFVQKFPIPKLKLTVKDTFFSGLSMAKLGFFIITSAIGLSGTMYVVRYFLLRWGGMDTVGIFQAAWTITALYIGLILNSMLADFFPRLSKIHNDLCLVRQYTNEQSEVTFLLGGPMIIFMIIVLPIIVPLLYSHEFVDCIKILQWQLAAEFITFMTWPLGVIFLAKNVGQYSVITDFIWFACYLIIFFLGWDKYGLEILGISVFIANIIKYVAVYLIVRFQFSFKWTRRSIKLIFINGIASLLTLGVVKLDFVGKYILLILIFSGVSLYSIICLNKVLRWDRLLKRVK